jgi:hypothetical protein
MLLKISKRLPSIQNDSPVMNKQGSLDSPVEKTPGSLVYFEEVSEQVHKKFLLTKRQVVKTPGSRLLGEFRRSIRTG